MHLPLFIFFFCFPAGNTTNPPPTTYYPPQTTQGPSGNENKHENNFQRKQIQIEILKILAQSLMFLLKIATSPYPTDRMKSENAVPSIIVRQVYSLLCQGCSIELFTKQSRG